MTQYTATIMWERNAATFTDSRYSRGHQWQFDGGVVVPASASPHAVPRPFAVDAAVDPEEAFVAALASCHMLWFLSIAAKQGFVIDHEVMHHDAHEQCFIANSVKTTVRCEPSDVTASHKNQGIDDCPDRPERPGLEGVNIDD